LRNHADFLIPAIFGLSESQAKKLAIACDAAIVFGVMAYREDATGSLHVPIQALQKIYDEKIKVLKQLTPEIN